MKSYTVPNTLKWLMFVPFIVLLGTTFAHSFILANGVVSAKYFWFEASMALMIPVVFFLKPINRIYFSDWLVLLLVGSILIVSVLSGPPFASTKLILLVLLLLLYIFIRRLVTSFRAAEYLITLCLIGTALVECIVGLRQLYGFAPSNHELFKLTGTFFNPGPYGGYVGMLFPLALYHALLFSKKEARLRRIIAQQLLMIQRVFSRPRIWWSYLLGCLSMVTVFVSLLVIPAAMSRAAWIGIAVGSSVVLLTYDPVRRAIKGYVNTPFKHILVTTVMVVIIGGTGVGIYAIKPDSADGRLLLWKNALQTIVEHPFGVGIGKLGHAVGETQAAYFAGSHATQAEIDRADVPFYTFNEYLQIGVESGVIALALFVGMLVVTLKNAFKEGQYGIAGALLSLSSFAFFSYPFSVLPFLVVLVFLLAMSNADGHNRPVMFNRNEASCRPFTSFKRSCSIFTSILSAGLIIYCLVDRYPTYKAWRDWAGCKHLINAELYNDASEDMKTVYPYLNDQPDFLFDYALSLSKSGYYQESNHILQRCMSYSSDPMLYNILGKNCMAQHQYDQAEAAFKQAYNLVPNRVYPLYLLTKLYAEKGETHMVRETTEKVFNHTIIVPSNAIEEMKDSLKRLLMTESF